MDYALACYKLALDGGDGESNEEDPRNLDIVGAKGEHEV